MVVPSRDISKIVSKLKSGKSAGIKVSDGICAEFLKFVFMFLLIFFVHGYLPSAMTEICIIHVFKTIIMLQSL